MKWRPQPETAEPSTDAQWVGREGSEDVAWIVEWRGWGDQGRQWQVATPHGTAAGVGPPRQEAPREVEEVLRADPPADAAG